MLFLVGTSAGSTSTAGPRAVSARRAPAPWLDTTADRYVTVENNGTFLPACRAADLRLLRARRPTLVMAVKAPLPHPRPAAADPAEARVRAPAARGCRLGDRLGPGCSSCRPDFRPIPARSMACLDEFSSSRRRRGVSRRSL